MWRSLFFLVDALMRKEGDENGENVKKAYITSENRDTLPTEMINEILIRLPVESLLRCKCVCKQWLSLIECHNFVSEHWLRSSPAINDLSVVADNDGMKSIGECRGLLLEKNAETRKMHIRNPATRQVLDLPDPGWVGISYEFLRYIECTRTFKVVSFHYEADKYAGWRVLTIGTDTLCWKNCLPPFAHKVITVSPRGPRVFALDMFIINCPGTVFTNGVLLDEIQVRSFDLISNQLRQTCVPREFWANIDMARVKPCTWNDDRLAYAYIAEEKLHITVLEDFRTETWSAEKTVIPLDFLKNQQYAEMMSSSGICFDGLEGDSLRFHFCRLNLFVSYNLKTKEVVEMEPEPEPDTAQADKLRPSLVKLEGMHPQPEPLKGASSSKSRRRSRWKTIVHRALRVYLSLVITSLLLLLLYNNLYVVQF